MTASLTLSGCLTAVDNIENPASDAGLDEGDGAVADAGDAARDAELAPTDSGQTDAGQSEDASQEELDSRPPDVERPPIDENLPETMETATFAFG